MNRTMKWLVLVLWVAGSGAVAPSALAQSSDLEELTLSSGLVPSDVAVGVLLPPGYGTTTRTYPLLLLLHGGGGSSAFLERVRPLMEGAWADDDLPEAVVVTPSVGRSFYLDYRDGSQMWETFVMTELLPSVREQYRVDVDGAGTIVAGYSMGGMGALRLAFKHPRQFRAVAALAPAIEPVFSFDDIQASDRSHRPDSVYWERFGNPVDRDYWQANHPLSIARERLAVIGTSGLQIYLEVGDLDRLNLFRGTELLHRLLYDGGVKHEYRLVRGADHIGESVPARLRNALGFIGRVLRAAE